MISTVILQVNLPYSRRQVQTKEKEVMISTVMLQVNLPHSRSQSNLPCSRSTGPNKGKEVMISTMIVQVILPYSRSTGPECQKCETPFLYLTSRASSFAVLQFLVQGVRSDSIEKTLLKHTILILIAP